MTYQTVKSFYNLNFVIDNFQLGASNLDHDLITEKIRESVCIGLVFLVVDREMKIKGVEKERSLHFHFQIRKRHEVISLF